jgi:hypothetical protein
MGCYVTHCTIEIKLKDNKMGISSNGFSVTVRISRNTEQDEVLAIVKSLNLDYDFFGNELTISPIFCEDEASELEVKLKGKLEELRKDT